MPFVNIVIKAPMATLNAIVINSLLTKECVAFSNVSVFGVHTAFAKRTVFRFMRFISVFEKFRFHSGAM